MPDEFLTTSQAAALLGLSARQVLRYAESGSLPSWTTPGGQRRFRRADVEAASPPPTPADPVSAPQLRYLHAMLRKSDVGHDQRHGFASHHLGRAISSLTELSRDEASRLLDELERERERDEQAAAALLMTGVGAGAAGIEQTD